MIDYHLHTKSLHAALIFIEYVSKKYNEEENIVSFSQHEEMDLYTSYPLIDYGSRLGVKIVKSITFRSSEGIEFNILNPKNNIDELLNKSIEEKTNRIIHILKRLSNFDIFITPKQLIDKLGKPELLDIHLADVDDIAHLIVDNGYCENIRTARNMYLDRISIPRKFSSIEYILSNLIGNEIFVNNPAEFIEYAKQSEDADNLFKKIDGFITTLNPEVWRDALDVSNILNNIKILNGSGEVID